MTTYRSISVLVVWVLILALLWLTGCAPMRFANAGSSNTLAQDGYDCDREWDRSGPGMAYAMDPLGSLGYLAMARGDKEACMARKGWKRVDP